MLGVPGSCELGMTPPAGNGPPQPDAEESEAVGELWNEDFDMGKPLKTQIKKEFFECLSFSQAY